MKKYIISMIVAVFAFIAMLPSGVKAAEAGDNIVISDNNDGSANVSLSMPDAAIQKVSTIKVTLSVEPNNTGDNSVVFTFAPELEANTKVHEYRYHSDTSRLTIYVADSDPLFADGKDTILLGTIKADSRFRVTVEPGALSAVIGTNEEAISLDDHPTMTIGDDDGDPDRPVGDIIKDIEDLIQEAEGLNKADYTEDSYNALMDAINNAKAVLANPASTPEEIAQALNDLQNAFGALTPVQKDSSQDKLEQDVQDNKVKDPNLASGNTGDATIIWPYITAIVACGGLLGAFVIIKQKTKDSETKK